jgi:hypothetical protein
MEGLQADHPAEAHGRSTPSSPPPRDWFVEPCWEGNLFSFLCSPVSGGILLTCNAKPISDQTLEERWRVPPLGTGDLSSFDFFTISYYLTLDNFRAIVPPTIRAPARSRHQVPDGKLPPSPHPTRHNSLITSLLRPCFLSTHLTTCLPSNTHGIKSIRKTPGIRILKTEPRRNRSPHV